MVSNLPSPTSGGGAIRVYELSFGRSDLARLRADVARAASSAGLAPERVMDFVLAAHELASNSVVHGGGRGRLRLWTEDDELVCEVSDRGLLADGDAGTTKDFQSGGGGAGLGIVRRVSDAFTIGGGAHTGTVACMRVGIRHDAQKPASTP